MQYFPRAKAAVALVVLSFILFAFMLLVTTNTISNVSAVETYGVGVYWDSNCDDTVSFIDWGTLEPGSSKNRVVYIRNHEDEPTFLIMWTMNWVPSKASEYLTFKWDYSLQRIELDGVLQITLTLSVSRYIEGISSFNFDIIITGSQRLPGDVNGDGKVTGLDQTIVGVHLFTKAGDPYYSADADVNGDGKVTGLDQTIVGMHLWKSA